MNTFSRIVPDMNVGKRSTLLNIFFISQFNYCPLWMCHSRAKNKINRLQKVPKDYLQRQNIYF